MLVIFNCIVYNSLKKNEETSITLALKLIDVLNNNNN